jgi:hypothetical protein
MYSSPEVAVHELDAVVVDDQPAHGLPGLIATWGVIGGAARIRRVLGKQLFASRKPLLQVCIGSPTLARRGRGTRGTYDICLGGTVSEIRNPETEIPDAET